MIEITYEGKTYGSIKALADAKGFSYSTLRRRVLSGWRPEDWLKDLVKGRPRAITYEGKTFESLKKVCEYYGLDYKLVCTRLRRGYPLDLALTNPYLARNPERAEIQDLIDWDPKQYAEYKPRHKFYMEEKKGGTDQKERLGRKKEGELIQAEAQAYISNFRSATGRKISRVELSELFPAAIITELDFRA